LGTDHSVSIAAPASYWYLKAFPIDRIAAVIDYIVYMTYDLHGQWDAGNPNTYDQCDSGRCIRSHVNLTETRNSLAISKP
jgi:GH18 family chitinase